MKNITWEDLVNSGPIIQIIFKTMYPEGLTEEEMMNSSEGWIRRAYLAWKGGE